MVYEIPLTSPGIPGGFLHIAVPLQRGIENNLEVAERVQKNGEYFLATLIGDLDKDEAKRTLSEKNSLAHFPTRDYGLLINPTPHAIKFAWPCDLSIEDPKRFVEVHGNRYRPPATLLREMENTLIVEGEFGSISGLYYTQPKLEKTVEFLAEQLERRFDTLLPIVGLAHQEPTEEIDPFEENQRQLDMLIEATLDYRRKRRVA